jgi:hypothetical protein
MSDSEDDETEARPTPEQVRELIAVCEKVLPLSVEDPVYERWCHVRQGGVAASLELSVITALGPSADRAICAWLQRGAPGMRQLIGVPEGAVAEIPGDGESGGFDVALVPGSLVIGRERERVRCTPDREHLWMTSRTYFPGTVWFIYTVPSGRDYSDEEWGASFTRKTPLLDERDLYAALCETLDRPYHRPRRSRR